jgi:hypothetical protein
MAFGKYKSAESWDAERRHLPELKRRFNLERAMPRSLTARTYERAATACCH